MRVLVNNPEFRPVSIHFDSPEDVHTFRKLLVNACVDMYRGLGYPYGKPEIPSGPEWEMYQTLDKLLPGYKPGEWVEVKK